jgi:hypothetical protein
MQRVLEHDQMRLEVVAVHAIVEMSRLVHTNAHDNVTPKVQHGH